MGTSNSLIKTKSDKDLLITPENLNDFFLSVFKQAPLLPKGQKHTVKSTPSKILHICAQLHVMKL